MKLFRFLTVAGGALDSVRRGRLLKPLGQPAQPGVHAADQKDGADREQQDDDQTGRPSQPTRIASVTEVVCVSQPLDHGHPFRCASYATPAGSAATLAAPATATPANRS